MIEKIKRIRSYRGGEYIPLNDYTEKERIVHEVIPLYSPKPNGVVERKNKTLKKMMNSMLVSVSTPKNLWGEDILSTCHLHNIISYGKTSWTPYKLWKGHAPNLKYLKVWGCHAKVMLPELKKRKI